MAYTSSFVPNLTDNDYYRFAEIELNHALDNLTRFFVHSNPAPNKALTVLVDQLFPLDANPEHVQLFKQVLADRRYKISKKEYINYFRSNGFSYGDITKYTGISSQTTRKMQTETPLLRPYYPYWDHEMLARWNTIRDYVVIWNG